MASNLPLQPAEGYRNILGKIAYDFSTLRKYKSLIFWTAHSKDFNELFKTWLGSFWRFLEPLSNMLIYYFLVVVIFRSGLGSSVSPFLYIMLGLVHYNLIQRSGTSASIITDNETILKQIPIEPIVFIGVQFLRFMRSSLWGLLVYVLFFFYFQPQIGYQIIAYPFLILLLAMFSWSLCVLAATAGVFLRDLQKLSSIGIRILMYFSPVIYLSSFFPQRLRDYLFFNPVACLFSLFQWSILGEALGESCVTPKSYHIAFMITFVISLFIGAHWYHHRVKSQFTKVF